MTVVADHAREVSQDVEAVLSGVRDQQDKIERTITRARQPVIAGRAPPFLLHIPSSSQQSLQRLSDFGLVVNDQPQVRLAWPKLVATASRE